MMKIHWTDGRKAAEALRQHIAYGQAVTVDEARQIADANGIDVTDEWLTSWVDTHNGQPVDPFEGLTS